VVAANYKPSEKYANQSKLGSSSPSFRVEV